MCFNLSSYKPFSYRIDFVAPPHITVAWQGLLNGNFTLVHVILSSGRTSTATRNNLRTFKAARELPPNSEIGQWVRAPRPARIDDDDEEEVMVLEGPPERSRFEGMKMAEFTRLVEIACEELIKPVAGPSTGKKRSHDSPKDGEEKKRKKHKRKQRRGSEDIDQDST